MEANETNLSDCSRTATSLNHTALCSSVVVYLHKIALSPTEPTTEPTGTQISINSDTIVISNGNRTEWSPVSVIIRVITKSDDRAAGVRFVYHEYDYRPNWTTRSPITN